MQLGRAIKELRTETGLTQKELARLIGITQSHLSQIESCSKQPSLSTLEHIAEELGLSVPMLIVFAMEKDDIRPEKKEVYDRFYPKLKSLLGEEVVRQE